LLVCACIIGWVIRDIRRDRNKHRKKRRAVDYY
jgi:hypothetical protein